MKKRSAPPLKGQKSITSFVFQKQQSAIVIDDPEPTSALIPPSKDETRPGKSSKTLPSESKETIRKKWHSKICTSERLQRAIATPQQQKMTPLELQVASLKQKHPGNILAIECGYRFQFFGLPDAEVASQVLNIFAYQDRNYLKASVPTFTIERHIRRLVNAGHKVGIVTQTETAAIKASSDTRNKPFQRELTGVFTRATIEAGALSAISSIARATGGKNGGGDAESNAPAQGSHDDVLFDAYNEERSSFFVCVVESNSPEDDSKMAIYIDDDEEYGMVDKVTTEETAHFQQHQSKKMVDIAIVAVETSTGQVIYSQVKDGPMRSELESRLLFTPPADLLIVEPVSRGTNRLLEKSSGNRAIERTDGAAYKAGGAMPRVVDFYRAHASMGGGCQIGNYNSASAPRTMTAHPGSIMDKIVSLPPLVINALAHSLDYLEPFGLEGALLHSFSFKEYSEIKELELSPNALQQLEILRNTDDGKERGSLLWLMDRTLTAPGSRLMRRWVSRPLTDLVGIRERLDAVKELVEDGRVPCVDVFYIGRALLCICSHYVVIP